MDVLNGICFGEVVLTVQDGMLIQVERVEKVRVHPWKGLARPPIWPDETVRKLRGAIKREVGSLYYGRLCIAVKQGMVTHFDRLEKQRFMDGDGI